MRCIRKNFIRSLVALYLLASSPRTVLAAAWDESCFESSLGAVANDVATIRCIEPLIGNLIQALASLAGVALFIMLVIGGYKYLLSGGDQKKLEQARQTLTYAILGLVVMASAYLILKTIQTFIGTETDILNFEVRLQP